ncbi:MAG: hypothetical protein Q8909_21330 [Bacteroidota bacterium]|nr:hypothetical protein [Bacteroidota bacterium]
MKKALLVIFFLTSMVPLSISQDYGVPADLALFANYNGPADFVYKSLQFHEDQKVDGVIAPIEVNGRNGRNINSYAYSYRNVNINNVTAAGANFSAEAGPEGGLQLDVALQAGIAANTGWKQTTNALQGRYTSEDSLDVNSQVILVGEILSTPLTRMLGDAGVFAFNNYPIVNSDIKSRNSLMYSGKEINDIETGSNFMGAMATASASLSLRGNPIFSVQRELFEKSQQQSTKAEFLYNSELTKNSDSHLQSGIFMTTDNYLYPSYMSGSIASSIDYNLSSHSTGVADLSYAQLKKNLAQRHPVAEYEGRDRYVGDYKIARKLHLSSYISDWSLGEGLGQYDWLPCTCQQGWNDMILHDQRYHSAAPNAYLHGPGFFDCTTCPTPYCLPMKR